MIVSAVRRRLTLAVLIAAAALPASSAQAQLLPAGWAPRGPASSAYSLADGHGGGAAPSRLAHAAQTDMTVDQARSELAADGGDVVPLFFSDDALANAHIVVDSVQLTTGDQYSATVFYRQFDGGESQGQLWMDRGPAGAPTTSFDSCVGDPMSGPLTLGPFQEVYFGKCDIDFIYRFVSQSRMYTVASKYYGGLTPDTLAGIVAGLTPVVATTPPASQPPPAAATGVPFIAMGDSYSSGEGLSPFQQSAPLCHRSQIEAYPELLDSALAFGQLGFVACTGATTNDFSHPQKDGTRVMQAPQLSLLQQAAGSATKLVTLTLGGDDAGFASVLQDCLVAYKGFIRVSGHGCPASDKQSVVSTLAILAGKSRPRSGHQSVLSVLEQIHTVVPNARIALGNYPLLLPAAHRGSCQVGHFHDRSLHLTFALKFRHADVQWLDSVGQQLDGMIRSTVTQARAHGIDTVLADAASQFRDHGVACAGHNSSTNWINQITASGTPKNPVPEPSSMHPTAAGQQAYERAFAAALKG
jgi:hypothetical protein